MAGSAGLAGLRFSSVRLAIFDDAAYLWASVGELLYGTTYIALDRPVELSLQARNVDSSGWAIPRLRWDDPGRLRFEVGGP